MRKKKKKGEEISGSQITKHAVIEAGRVLAFCVL
jgi:hypothetical protein